MMEEQSDITKKIREYLLEFIFRDTSLSIGDDDSFLEKGVIDSTGILELTAFLEKTFDIKVEDEEIVPDNMDSFNKLISFVNSKLKN